MRYRVYRWEFSYLDYSFDVLTSRIGNLGLYNCFTTVTLLAILLPATVCMCSQYDFQYILFVPDLSIHMCLSLHGTCSYLTTRWGVLTPLNLHVQILELVPWWTFYWSEWHSGSIVDQQKTGLEPYPSRPPDRPSSFSFVTREGILYYSSLYTSLYSIICAISVM